MWVLVLNAVVIVVAIFTIQKFFIRITPIAKFNTISIKQLIDFEPYGPLLEKDLMLEGHLTFVLVEFLVILYCICL